MKRSNIATNSIKTLKMVHTHTHTHTHTQKTSINLEKEARIKWEGMSPVKSGDHKGQGLGA